MKLKYILFITLFVLLYISAVHCTSARFPGHYLWTFDEEGRINRTEYQEGEEIPCVAQHYIIPRQTAKNRILSNAEFAKFREHKIYSNPFISGITEEDYKNHQGYTGTTPSPFCSRFDCGIVYRSMQLMIDDPMMSADCFHNNRHCPEGEIVLIFEGCIFAAVTYDDEIHTVIPWTEIPNHANATGMIFMYDRELVYEKLNF